MTSTTTTTEPAAPTTTYGHADAALAAQRIRDAYRTRPTDPIPLRRKVAS